MSMLVDVYGTSADAASLVEAFGELVFSSAGASGETKICVDDRAVSRWFFRRGSDAERCTMDRLFRRILGTPGLRVVVDRGVGAGACRVHVPLASTDGVDLVRSVLAGDAHDGCSVVQIVVS